VRWAVGLIVASLAFGACNVLAPGNATTAEVAVPYPEGCAAFQLSARRCKAIVDWAIEQSNAGGRDVASVGLLGPGGRCKRTETTLCVSTTSFVVRVRLQFDDGGTAEQVVSCGIGGEYSILCTEQPQIRFSGETMGGYRDIPCANENGVGCATPLPALEPVAIAAARPLHVATFDIPIDHEGHYEVELGRATLANGVLSDSRARLGNPATQAVRMRDEGIQLDVRSMDPGAPPFGNYYQRGWHPGIEEVIVSLRFDVVSLDRGAVLEVRDVVVE
jgi:hypothetical protein